jgi:hypothetical protein
VAPPRRATLAGAAGRWRRAVAGRRGSHPSGVPGISGRAAGSGPAGTALRRQGRAVARAAGPRHHCPRLRHKRHRRGAASAASRPPQARARVFASVCQSAQPPADRSVRRLRRRRHWTAPASRWAARRRSGPPSARQRARTAAAPSLASLPPRGSRRKAPVPLHSARAADSCHPATPSRGCCASLTAPGGQRLRRSCRCPSAGFLSPCQASQCTAAGLLRQDPASRRAPAGPPPWVGRQRRPEGVPDGLQCWRTAVAGPVRTGG